MSLHRRTSVFFRSELVAPAFVSPSSTLTPSLTLLRTLWHYMGLSIGSPVGRAVRSGPDAWVQLRDILDILAEHGVEMDVECGG